MGKKSVFCDFNRVTPLKNTWNHFYRFCRSKIRRLGCILWLWGIKQRIPGSAQTISALKVWIGQLYRAVMFCFLPLKYAWVGKYSCCSHIKICGSKSCFNSEKEGNLSSKLQFSIRSVIPPAVTRRFPKEIFQNVLSQIFYPWISHF